MLPKDFLRLLRVRGLHLLQLSLIGENESINQRELLTFELTTLLQDHRSFASLVLVFRKEERECEEEEMETETPSPPLP